MPYRALLSDHCAVIKLLAKEEARWSTEPCSLIGLMQELRTSYPFFCVFRTHISNLASVCFFNLTSVLLNHILNLTSVFLSKLLDLYPYFCVFRSHIKPYFCVFIQVVRFGVVKDLAGLGLSKTRDSGKTQHYLKF